MNEISNVPGRHRISGTGIHVSFADAARFLGVDTFTFYTFVQRGEISAVLTEWGEYVVSQQDLDNLIAAKE